MYAIPIVISEARRQPDAFMAERAGPAPLPRACLERAASSHLPSSASSIPAATRPGGEGRVLVPMPIEAAVAWPSEINAKPPTAATSPQHPPLWTTLSNAQVDVWVSSRAGLLSNTDLERTHRTLRMAIQEANVGIVAVALTSGRLSKASVQQLLRIAPSRPDSTLQRVFDWSVPATLMVCAFDASNQDIVELLLAVGGPQAAEEQLTATTRVGATLLHCAVRARWVGGLELLKRASVKYGFELSLSTRNRQGKSPLGWANLYACPKAGLWLITEGALLRHDDFGWHNWAALEALTDLVTRETERAARFIRSTLPALYRTSGAWRGGRATHVRMVLAGMLGVPWGWELKRLRFYERWSAHDVCAYCADVPAFA